MKQITLARWLKLALLGLLTLLLFAYSCVVPFLAKAMLHSYPEFENRLLPWLIFIELTAVPCLCAFFYAWKISCNISRDRSFCRENAKYMRTIALLAGVDAAYFFLGNAVLLFANMSHPGIALFSLIAVFVGLAVCVAAAALSHLIQKAADIQEESELTI